MRRIRNALTRIHLWIGEALGLTHYRNCWYCKHVDNAYCVPEICGCARHLDEVDSVVLKDPCEAVWCEDFEWDDLR